MFPIKYYSTFRPKYGDTSHYPPLKITKVLYMQGEQVLVNRCIYIYTFLHIFSHILLKDPDEWCPKNEAYSTVFPCLSYRYSDCRNCQVTNTHLLWNATIHNSGLCAMFDYRLGLESHCICVVSEIPCDFTEVQYSRRDSVVFQRLDQSWFVYSGLSWGQFSNTIEGITKLIGPVCVG